MSNLYEKLGNLLNETLEHSEKINSLENITNNSSNQIRKDKIEDNPNEKDNNSEKKSDNIRFSNFQKDLNLKSTFFSEKEPEINGEVIKLYNYTENMQFSPEITNALSTLDIAYPFSEEELKVKYRKMLLKYHPDNIETTIQDTKIVYKLRQLQTEKIISSYKILLNLVKKE